VWEGFTETMRNVMRWKTMLRENADLISQVYTTDDIKTAKAEGKTGILRLAYMAIAATELMPHAVSHYRRLYPHVEMNLRYMRTQGQKVALAQDEVDIGYMIGPFDHDDFHSHKLAADPLYVVTPLNHRLARLHAKRHTPKNIAFVEANTNILELDG